MMRVIFWPIISSLVWPNIVSAALFQDVTLPLRSLPTIASSEDPAIAASQKRASSSRPCAWGGESGSDVASPATAGGWDDTPSGVASAGVAAEPARVVS